MNKQFLCEICAVLSEAVQQIHEHKINKVTEKGDFDFVTNMDIELEQILIKGLCRIDNIPCLTEESERTMDSSSYWIIDPIDGTTNFMHGYPSYCVSIAKVQDGKTEIGLVYNFVSGELFVGVANEGAYRLDAKVLDNLRFDNLSAHKICVSNVQRLKNALVAFGCPYDRDKSNILFRISDTVFQRCHDLKRNGPASLDICYVACGRLDAYYEFDLKEWDYQAAKLILEEAGGLLTDWQGKEELVNKNNVIASNSRVHTEMLECIRQSIMDARLQWYKREILNRYTGNIVLVDAQGRRHVVQLDTSVGLLSKYIRKHKKRTLFLNSIISRISIGRMHRCKKLIARLRRLSEEGKISSSIHLLK